MSFGYDYTHSGVDGNGFESISFMMEPERLSEYGLREGKAVKIEIDNKRQKSTVFRFDWIGGGPKNFQEIAVLKDEIVCDDEIPGLMKRLGIELVKKQANSKLRKG